MIKARKVGKPSGLFLVQWKFYKLLTIRKIEIWQQLVDGLKSMIALHVVI
jgi:hypothetical protein